MLVFFQIKINTSSCLAATVKTIMLKVGCVFATAAKVLDPSRVVLCPSTSDLSIKGITSPK